MSTPKKPYLIVIVGPTAVGKSALALEICRKFNGEIISADSRQFYRQLSIGTAKPTPQEMAEIPHHLVDMLDINEEYTAGKFENDAVRVIDKIVERGSLPVMVGGSGLYIKAVLEGLDSLPANAHLRKEIEKLYKTKGIEALQERLKLLDPVYYNKIDTKNHVRLIRAIEILELSEVKMRDLLRTSPKRRNFKPLIIGLERPRADLYKQINKRVDEMIDRGLVAEAEAVKEYKSNQALQTVGYKELFPYFEGEYNLKRAIELIKQDTRNYAKRQITWLRKLDDVQWFNYADHRKIIDFLQNQLSGNSENNPL